MALVFPRSSFGAINSEMVRQHLCFQAPPPDPRRPDEAPPPILFYDIEGPNIRLPLFYGAAFARASNIQPLPSTHATAKFKFTGTLRDYQVEIAGEAWGQLQEHRTTTLAVYPGAGKTIIGAELAARAGLLTVVLLPPREVLCGQWKKTFCDHTTASVWIVGEPQPAEANVIICMSSRVDQLPAAYRACFGFMIVDEAHMHCTPGGVHPLLAFSPRYIVAETATLERTDGMHAMIHATCGAHSVVRKMEKSFTVTKVMTGIKPARQMTYQGRVDWAALERSLVNHAGRNALIVDIVAANASYKVLVLTSQIAHARQLHAAIKARGIPTDYLVGGKKTYSDSRALVGTMSKIGTGFDEATSCPDYSGERINLVILTCSIKKHARLEQNVGRAFRSESPNVIHLVDDDTIIASHWTSSRKWYIEHGGTINETRLHLDE